MLSISGTKVVVEEHDCFKIADPNNNQRPDLSICNNFHESKKVICDISVVHPYSITGSVILNRNAALHSMRAANTSYQTKIRKYKNISEANDLLFAPLIFETTGKYHNDTLEFFNRIMDLMKGDLDLSHQDALSFYWSGRISCCIQKCIANAFLKKTMKLNGGNINNNHIHTEDYLDNSRFPDN